MTWRERERERDKEREREEEREGERKRDSNGGRQTAVYTNLPVLSLTLMTQPILIIKSTHSIFL